MSFSVFVLLLVSTFVNLSPGASPAVGPQQEEILPDKREVIARALQELGSCVGKNGKEDARAIALLAELAREFSGSGPKDRKAMVRGVDACLKSKRATTNKLHIAAAQTLGEMGPESVRSLTKLMRVKAFQKRPEVLREVVLSLGGTEDEAAVPTLLAVLAHKNHRLTLAAVDALQNFDAAKPKVRKKIFEELLKTVVKGRSKASEADVVQDAIMNALPMLARHYEATVPGWQVWWKENRNKNWLREDEG